MIWFFFFFLWGNNLLKRICTSRRTFTLYTACTQLNNICQCCFPFFHYFFPSLSLYPFFKYFKNKNWILYPSSHQCSDYVNHYPPICQWIQLKQQNQQISISKPGPYKIQFSVYLFFYLFLFFYICLYGTQGLHDACVMFSCFSIGVIWRIALARHVKNTKPKLAIE
jgi:hypothetical protein